MNCFIKSYFIDSPRLLKSELKKLKIEVSIPYKIIKYIIDLIKTLRPFNFKIKITKPRKKYKWKFSSVKKKNNKVIIKRLIPSKDLSFFI